MRWLQLRFDFDSTAVRLLTKGHYKVTVSYVSLATDPLATLMLTYLLCSHP